jgi:glycogen(starch) synthase
MNCFGPSWVFHQDTARNSDVPLVATLHTLPEHTMILRALGPDGLLRRTLRSADWVTCVSAAVMTQTRELVPEMSAHSSVIYNGMEDPSVAPTPLPLDPPGILCVGRLVPEKGFDLALRAFAALTASFPVARLIVAGDGPSRPDLERQATELGLRGLVDFIGWIAPDRISELINNATVVVMPSRSEALPSVALEAGMMARPIVASRVGGIPEIVIDHETGLLIDPEDVESLANAIGFLLRQPATAREFGHAARRRIQTFFSFDRYVDAYEALYKQLAARLNTAVARQL